MKHQTMLVVAALVALSTLVPAPTAKASCPYLVRSLAEWRDEASVIFVGRAIETTRRPVAPKAGDPEGLSPVELETRFAVEERFKGDVGKQVTVLAARAWDDCVVTFDAGERYVVFAFERKWNVTFFGDREPRGKLALRTDHSSPTAPVAMRPDVLAYLRRVATGRAPSVVGAIYDHTPRSISNLYERTILEWRRVATRGGVRVLLRTGDRTFETIPGDDGAFVFEDLPAGTYSIWLELPPGMRLEEQSETVPYNWLPDSDHPERVVIAPNTTVARYFTVSDTARVRGRAISPTGAPARETSACLVRASDAAGLAPGRPVENVRAFVGDDGAFEFETVPPGDYLLAINSERDDAYDGNGPAFFYPGVFDPENATRIRIEDGMTLDVGDVKAPHAGSFRSVDVEVVDPHGMGREAALLLTSGRDGREFFFHIDATGRTRLWLRPGVHFRVEAKGWGEEGKGESYEIPADGTLAPIRLVVAAAAPVR
jgi:hypothetical protein